MASVFYTQKKMKGVNLKYWLCISGLVLFWLFIFCENSYGQEDLQELLKGKTKLSEIMAVVDTFYRAHPEDKGGAEEEFESEYLHWKRWEWYMSGRLGHGGEFVNISEKLMEGLADKEKMPVSHDRNINAGWAFVGPSTYPLYNNSAQGNGIGRVDRIVFHPTNANIIFLCTPAGGLWNTLNGGTSWNNLSDNLPCTGVSGFVISYANTSIMYMLTGDGDSRYPNSGLVDFGYPRNSIGVLKSIDGGLSWHQTGVFPNVSGPYGGYQLVQNPTDPEILFAATSNGLYRTVDGGTTWVRKITAPTYDVDFKPGDGTRVYASVKGDFWISTNSGFSFTSNSTYDMDPGSCGGSGGRIQIGVTPSNVNDVYLLAGPVISSGMFCGIWKSTDSGLTFTRQSTSPNVFDGINNGSSDDDQTYYDIAIACNPDLATNVVVAGCSVWRSANSGATWTHCTNYFEGGNLPYIHPDVHDLAFNPINNWLYASSDGGVFRSQDFGITWTDLSPNIETSMFYHMRGWDGNINKLMGGLQDNGVKYRNNNSSAFNHIMGADGFDVVFNPDTGQPQYATANDFYTIFSNDGQSAASYVYQAGYFFKTLAIHNTNPDTFFLGSSSIYKSVDGGMHFTSGGASGSWALTSCPSNNNRFYAAGGAYYGTGTGALYFSGDIGSTWTMKSTNPGFPDQSNWIKITDVTVRPTSSSTVWASFGGFDDGYKVVMSTNTGDTWTNMSANLPNVPVNCLAIDNDNGVYAGTDIGVFYRSPTMTQWMPWSNGLPNTPVSDLVIFDDGTNKKIRAATFGRGVWQSNLASTCDAAVVVTGGIEGIRHYEASNSISSTSVVQGGIGTFVSFQSGNYITLSDGFQAIDDSEFLGFISPCGQGGIPSVQTGGGTSRADSNSSIIILRRMWDKTDALPYGSIVNVETKNGHAKIDFRIKKEGKVQVYAARETQEKLVTLFSGELPAGKKSIDVNIESLPHQFHYVLLFYEGMLVHFQEMDLQL